MESEESRREAERGRGVRMKVKQEVGCGVKYYDRSQLQRDNEVGSSDLKYLSKPVVEGLWS